MRNLNVSSWLEAALAFFYPEVCQLCRLGRAGPDEGYVCGDCWHEVRFIEPPFCRRCGLPFSGEITQEFECANCQGVRLYFERARGAAVAKGPLREALHRYKYNNARWFGVFLADILWRQAGSSLLKEPCDLIVPVPLFPLKKREREFNQAEEISKIIGEKTNWPVETKAIARVRNTRTQTQLTRQERAENMRRAFQLKNDANIKNKRVLLIDDVLTTGATTNACARALKRGGAKEVAVWTVARGV